MKVVILAGGYGTRLSEITTNIPKPLVEISGKPLIWYIMKIYASQGFNDFIVACGYKGEKLKEYFMNLSLVSNDYSIDFKNNKISILKENKGEDWKVTLVDTGLNTLTGGRIKAIKDYIDGDTFMLTYGDGVADIDIQKLLTFHKTHGKKATLTVVKMPRYGIVDVFENGQIKAFHEKRLENSPLINGGFMILSKSVLDYIDKDVPFETTPMEKLSADNELYGYRHEGFWKAVDTLRDKIELEDILTDPKSQVKLWKD